MLTVVLNLEIDEMAEEPDDDISAIKVPLHRIVRDETHLKRHRVLAEQVNELVKAGYLFAKYIFTHEYEVTENFECDQLLTDNFFR